MAVPSNSAQDYNYDSSKSMFYDLDLKCNLDSVLAVQSVLDAEIAVDYEQKQALER